MIDRVRSTLAALSIVAMLGAAPPALLGPPVVLNVSAPLTGPGAFLGKSLIESFRAAETVVNESGGVRGRPFQIVTIDSQTSAPIGLQNVQGYIAKKVAFFIDGGPSPICNASLPLVAKSGPVDYCLSPAIRPPANGYVFSASAPSADVQRVAVRYFRLRGWKKIAMLSSTDASGTELEAGTMAALALPENRDVELVAREHFAPVDLSVAAQIARIEAAKPQAVLVWATGTGVGTAFHAISDAGLNVPVQVPSSNLVYAQLNAYAAFLPKQLYFATLLALTPGDMSAGPIRDAQRIYASALQRINVRPDAATNLAWDPTMMFVSALRHLGPDATADQIHEYMIHLHGYVGVNGIYDFAAGDQHGLAENGVQIAQWDAAKGTWVRASRPRGLLF